MVSLFSQTPQSFLTMTSPRLLTARVSAAALAPSSAATRRWTGCRRVLEASIMLVHGTSRPARMLLAPSRIAAFVPGPLRRLRARELPGVLASSFITRTGVRCYGPVVASGIRSLVQTCLMIASPCAGGAARALGSVADVPRSPASATMPTFGLAQRTPLPTENTARLHRAAHFHRSPGS